MKKIFVSIVFTLTAAWAQATLVSQSFSGGTITDGNPVGVVFGGNFTATSAGAVVSGVTVDLTISGGFNGNLYGYLVAPNGTVVTLLSQPGATTGNPFGYLGSGMTVTLSDTGTGNIQTTSEPPGALFNPGAPIQASGSLSGFTGSSANGEWTLFFADMVAGGGTSDLTGWSLNLTVVPEPVLMALVTFVVMLVALFGLKWTWRTKSWTNEPE